MTDLGQLIAKLEAASEGSRELDCLVHELLAPQHTPAMRGMYYGEPTGEYYEPDPGHPGGYVVANAMRFTTSLDAIVALIERKLPNWWVQYLGQTTKGWAVRIERQGTSLGLFDSTTPAIALCIAFLRALQAQQETSEDE